MMEIPYEHNFAGMWPPCPRGETAKVGSLSCQRCVHHASHTFGFIRYEETGFKRKYEVYGGVVICRKEVTGDKEE